MGRRGLAVLAVAAVLGTVSTGAAAAPCGGGSAGTGFDDVQDTDSFCNSAQWLKNRAISLGCGSGANYCPVDNVTRAAMALFLNRLGNAITPKYVRRATTTGGGNTLKPTTLIAVCDTLETDLPAVNYPQRVRARGTVVAPLSGSAVGLGFYRSYDGGTTRFTMNTLSTELLLSTPSGETMLHWSSNIITVPPGNAVTVSMGIINRGAGTLTVGSGGRCALEVEAVSAISGTAPFDAVE